MTTVKLVTVCLVIMMNLSSQYADGSTQTHSDAVHSIASPYVPLDSWIYPAIEQLSTVGLIQSASIDLRPWTRSEVARLIEEALQGCNPALLQPDVFRTLTSLQREFSFEIQERHASAPINLRIGSVYQQTTEIAGEPLTDGFHFAQTVVNQNGRNFGRGINSFSGIEMYGNNRFLSAQLQFEFQRAGGTIMPNRSTQDMIASVDFTPVGADGPTSNYFRGRLVQGAVSLSLSGNQFSFGKQPLWWGPARGSSTLFSNNAEPITMLRYDRSEPIVLPGLLHVLGEVRMQFLVGRLEGAQFSHTRMTTFGSPGRSLSDQPFLHGEKFSFQFTPNFEFGISRTVLFAGAGAPFTTSSFFRSIFSSGTGDERHDPGDRRNAVDATYRIPGLRKHVTGYFDGFSEDQPFPLIYPTESSWTSGVVLEQLPHLPRLTLRAEGLLSPHRNFAFPGFFYFNVHFLSGYTNNRQLIGSWIGREAQGEQFWATWRLSPQSFMEVSTRHQVVASEFLHGGSLTDITGAFECRPAHDWQLHIDAQNERWRFPLLSDRPQHNNAITIRLSYSPMGGKKL